jgi:hypothetical protein
VESDTVLTILRMLAESSELFYMDVPVESQEVELVAELAVMSIQL